ncbi:MAG: hypothetical protein ACRC7N_00705 [Clostridium sp.]
MKEFNRTEVEHICLKLSGGVSLESMANSLNIKVCFLESIIKEYDIKYSPVLKAYYHKKYEDEIKDLEKQKIKADVIGNVNYLYLKRYKGININECKDKEIATEEAYDRLSVEFPITLSEDLYKELKSIAKDKDLPIDLIIEQALLKMLERNKETRSKKAIKVYCKTLAEYIGAPLPVENKPCAKIMNSIINTLFSTEEQEENEDINKIEIAKLQEEIYKNILSEGFLISELSYADLDKDTEIYQKSYLLSKGNGYTLNILNGMEFEEWMDHYEIVSDKYNVYYGIKTKSYEEVKKYLNKEEEQS